MIMMASTAQRIAGEFWSWETKTRPKTNEIINVFNIDTKKIIAKYCLKDGFMRFLPKFLKDGGGKKLFYWNSILASVCPEVNKKYSSTTTRVVLRFFDMSLIWTNDNEDLFHLEPFGEYVVDDVDLHQPLSYNASDQKGPNIVLAFSKKFPDCLSQQFVTFSLEEKDLILPSIKVYDKNFLRYS